MRSARHPRFSNNSSPAITVEKSAGWHAESVLHDLPRKSTTQASTCHPPESGAPAGPRIKSALKSLTPTYYFPSRAANPRFSAKTFTMRSPKIPYWGPEVLATINLRSLAGAMPVDRVIIGICTNALR